MTTPDIRKLEAERLRPVPRNTASRPTLDELFQQLLSLIAAECRRAGMFGKRDWHAPEDCPGRQVP